MKNYESQAGDPHQSNTLAQHILARIRQTEQTLSPWVQRSLQAGAGPNGLEISRRPLSLITGASLALVNRVQNARERTIAWRPNQISISPHMVNRFASALTHRFEWKPIATAHPPDLPEMRPIQLPERLPLPSRAAFKDADDEQPRLAGSSPPVTTSPKRPDWVKFDEPPASGGPHFMKNKQDRRPSWLPPRVEKSTPTKPSTEIALQKLTEAGQPVQIKPTPKNLRIFSRVEYVSEVEQTPAVPPIPSSDPLDHLEEPVEAPGDDSPEAGQPADEPKLEQKPGLLNLFSPRLNTPIPQKPVRPIRGAKRFPLDPPSSPPTPSGELEQPQLNQETHAGSKGFGQLAPRQPELIEPEPKPVHSASLDNSGAIEASAQVAGSQRPGQETVLPTKVTQPASETDPVPAQLHVEVDRPPINPLSQAEPSGGRLLPQTEPTQIAATSVSPVELPSLEVGLQQVLPPSEKTGGQVTLSETTQRSSLESLDQTILRRAKARQQLPFNQNPSAPHRPTGTLPVTARQARTYLAHKGWRFKTKAEDTPTPSETIGRSLTVLEQKSGPGRPLPTQPREIIEESLGRDFGHVRVQTANLAPLNVEAATQGADIYIEPGQEQFDTPRSVALLSHELTHVAQRGLAAPKPSTRTAELPQAHLEAMPASLPPEEHEAEQNEQRFFDRPLLSRGVPAAAPAPNLLYRKPDEPARTGLKSISPALQVQPGPLEIAAPIANWLAAQERQESYPLVSPALPQTVSRQVDAEAETPTPAAEKGQAEAPEEAPAEPELDLDDLARQIYPILKRMMIVERERQPGYTDFSFR